METSPRCWAYIYICKLFEKFDSMGGINTLSLLCWCVCSSVTSALRFTPQGTDALGSAAGTCCVITVSILVEARYMLKPYPFAKLVRPLGSSIIETPCLSCLSRSLRVLLLSLIELALLAVLVEQSQLTLASF